MKQEGSAIVAIKMNKPTRAANKTNDSTFERIYKYYHDKSRLELDDDEEVIRKRWETAWHILTHHRTQKRSVEMLERMYGIKKSIAYDDVRNAMMLFGNPMEGMKDAKKAIAETAITEGLQLAWRRGNLDMHQKYLSKYIEINGLTVQEDDKMKDILSKLVATQITFVVSPEILKQEAEELLKGIPAIDVSHEEVDEEESEES